MNHHNYKLALAIAAIWCFTMGAAKSRGADAGLSPEMRNVQIGAQANTSRVPQPLRQGTFLSPQCVSAVDVSEGGQFVAVGTMAFRQDRNFFLLSVADAGKVLWGRHIEPWAPSQVAALAHPDGKPPAFAAAMAFARQTEPSPVVSLFRGELDKEVAAYDDVNWERGLLRYGNGDDWRTGWTASLLGDAFARSRDTLFTVLSNDGNSWHWTGNGSPARFALPRPRPFRMSVSGNGRVLAMGYIVPDLSKVEEPIRQRLQDAPRGLVMTVDAAKAAPIWNAAPLADRPLVPQPPEPADDFPDLAEPFNMKAAALVPFRVATSVSPSEDGSRVAATEYAGWMRVRRERLIGYWSGHGQGISFCPRQRGWLRIIGAGGKPVAQVELPAEGLFDVRIDSAGKTAWCIPASWFARGSAGCAWLPADSGEARTIFVYDIANKSWSALRFGDAVADAALRGDQVLVSCWNGRAYLVGRDGVVHAEIDVGGPARVKWSSDGSLAVIGTDAGNLFCLNDKGEVRWKTTLPVSQATRQTEPLKPVFDEIPVYSVGRVGPEHAYVGDTWLIKTDQGGILVDTGGTSGIPLTLEKIRAAGLDPREIKYLLLSHGHGDHANAAYLWRARGAELVAPASAAFTTAWVMGHWTGYGLAVPCPIDHPLPLKKSGDQAEITLCGIRIKAIFAPGHSPDSVVYFMELNGHRVIFTGDIAFDDRRVGMPLGSNVLHRNWGDREKAAATIHLIEQKVLPLKPEFEFKGHASNRDPATSWQHILEASRKALDVPKPAQ